MVEQQQKIIVWALLLAAFSGLYLPQVDSLVVLSGSVQQLRGSVPSKHTQWSNVTEHIYCTLLIKY